MNMNYSETYVHLNYSFHYPKPKYFDEKSQQAINFWEEKANYFQKSFILSVFLSASPIVLILLLIFLLSCMANLLQTWLIIKRNENRFNKIEKYKILLELNQKFLEKSNTNNSLIIPKDEEDVIVKTESNLKRKATHAFGLSELYIPDENKVPIVLLNEAIARQSIVGLSNAVEEKKQIEFDPEIAHLINELCHPMFVLTDEDETNSIIEIIKSEDEHQLKEIKDNSVLKSDDDRRNSKSNRRKSYSRKKAISKKISKSSEEDDGFNIKNIGKMILFTTRESGSEMNSSSDNDNNCEIKIVSRDKENCQKFPDIKIHVEDFDEVNKQNEDYSTKATVSNNDDNKIKGFNNQSYEVEDV